MLRWGHNIGKSLLLSTSNCLLHFLSLLSAIFFIFPLIASLDLRDIDQFHVFTGSVTAVLAATLFWSPAFRLHILEIPIHMFFNARATIHTWDVVRYIPFLFIGNHEHKYLP